MLSPPNSDIGYWVCVCGRSDEEGVGAYLGRLKIFLSYVSVPVCFDLGLTSRYQAQERVVLGEDVVNDW
jgi:hypothetical protein